MKTLQIITLSIAFIMLLGSCQSTKQILSKSNSRNEIINLIANDPDMSKEMMKALMESNSGKMMMQGNDKMKMMLDNHGMMMKMMKDNPGMMKNMMSNMMEAAKSDTSMMSSMCKSMMGNQQMMDMMKKMKGKNMDMKKMDKKSENKDETKPHH
ncbi:hypothetical protein [Pedobacter sp. JCM 36344]|uniref:hypothetical protein n=1 Tax=Pedobacter sp. JCM 36344 TaxID=3374280 RepID=UPI00397A0794